MWVCIEIIHYHMKFPWILNTFSFRTPSTIRCDTRLRFSDTRNGRLANNTYSRTYIFITRNTLIVMYNICFLRTCNSTEGVEHSVSDVLPKSPVYYRSDDYRPFNPNSYCDETLKTLGQPFWTSRPAVPHTRHIL